MASRTNRRPTMKDVAEHAGVSVATVSYVLSGRTGGGPGVRPETVDAVTRAARTIGYTANQAARTVRTGRSNLALLSLTMLADPWCQSVSAAVNLAAARAGLRALVLADGDWADLLAGYPVDVAFIDGAGPEDRDRLRALARRGLRLVVFSDDLDPDGFDVIRSPALPGCALAVEHLLQRHTRIGCLASGSERRPTRRLEPYRRGLDSAGVAVLPGDVAYFDQDPSSAFGAALRLLDRPDRPTAVYATTDFAAIAAVNAAHQLGLTVPHDVAIIGAGNADECERTSPTLTSVGPVDFFTGLGDLLVRIAQDPAAHEPRRHDHPWTLHPRGSTDLTTLHQTGTLP